LERKAPTRPQAALHRLRHAAHVHIAVVQFAPRVADPDDRTAGKGLFGEALGPQRRPVLKARVAVGCKPLSAAKFVSHLSYSWFGPACRVSFRPSARLREIHVPLTTMS